MKTRSTNFRFGEVVTSVLVCSEAEAGGQQVETRAEMLAIAGVLRIISSRMVGFDCFCGSY